MGPWTYNKPACYLIDTGHKKKHVWKSLTTQFYSYRIQDVSAEFLSGGIFIHWNSIRHTGYGQIL